MKYSKYVRRAVGALLLVGGLYGWVSADQDLGKYCFKVGTYDDQLDLGISVANDFLVVSARLDGLDAYRLYGSGSGGESGPLRGLWQFGIAMRNDSMLFGAQPICSFSVRLNKTTLNGNLTLACSGNMGVPFMRLSELKWDPRCGGGGGGRAQARVAQDAQDGGLLGE